MKINNSLAASPFGRRRPVTEPTGEPFESLKQSIAQLSALKKKLRNQDQVLTGAPNYQGQGWAGADAMVISDDLKTRAKFSHRVGKDAILCTRHAFAIGDLYRKLVKITSDNYFTKLEMWGLATDAGQRAVSQTPSISQIDLAVVIIDEVIRIHKLWRRRAANDGRTYA
jgi:hypothetical protein